QQGVRLANSFFVAAGMTGRRRRDDGGTVPLCLQSVRAAPMMMIDCATSCNPALGASPGPDDRPGRPRRSPRGALVGAGRSAREGRGRGGGGGVGGEGGASPAPEPGGPKGAGFYAYFRGGPQISPADREAAARVIETWPQIRDTTRVNRLFLSEAVRFLAGEV